MSKTPKQTPEETPTTAPDVTAAVTEQVREITEKSVEQTKEVFSQIKDQADTAQRTLETTFETAQSNTAALSLKALAALRSNCEASFDHVEKLIAAKSMGEAVELQSAFVRHQIEVISDQAMEIEAAAIKAAEEISAPVTSAVEKAFKGISGKAA